MIDRKLMLLNIFMLLTERYDLRLLLLEESFVNYTATKKRVCVM
jgi:hypothetical protein